MIVELWSVIKSYVLSSASVLLMFIFLGPKLIELLPQKTYKRSELDIPKEQKDKVRQRCGLFYF